jgi:protein-L-isoaspartate(D-aspartate) O-methyltransferase
MTDFARARKTMVDNQIRTSGITDRRLLAALGAVPREEFVPDTKRPLAYLDEAIALSGQRWLAAPAQFARLVQLAAINGGEHVLDLGCGSGYSSAVLARLAGSVVAIEEEAALAAEAREILSRLDASNATVIEGPLQTAGKAQGPYDVIVLEGAVSEVPEAFFAQLKPEGRLVAAVGAPGKVPVANLFARSGKGIAASASFDVRMPRLVDAPRDEFVF